MRLHASKFEFTATRMKGAKIRYLISNRWIWRLAFDSQILSADIAAENVWPQLIRSISSCGCTTAFSSAFRVFNSAKAQQEELSRLERPVGLSGRHKEIWLLLATWETCCICSGCMQQVDAAAKLHKRNILNRVKHAYNCYSSRARSSCMLKNCHGFKWFNYCPRRVQRRLQYFGSNWILTLLSDTSDPWELKLDNRQVEEGFFNSN